ncbi:hypothetical protein FE257_010717 [Aspergillus nanangensis]|uniref:O-methyltransferase domain-containing protein n=1 Tax=Aspergillus nanangensis TaxID=2582783 RepID=A0AAD4GRW5_ASPNN|nr:hypothetical protein FE257_010717 [Aspergillus nanangensis]
MAGPNASQTDDAVHHINNIDSIATVPSNTDAVPQILQDIALHGEEFTDVPGQSRLQLLKSARALVRTLETPKESIVRLCWAEPNLYSAIYTAISLGLFPMLSREGDSPKTVSQLGAWSGADPVLLGRILRHLAAMGTIEETGPDEYQHTNLSRSLATDKYGSGFSWIAQGVIPSIYQLPQYLQDSGLRNPTNPTDGPFQHALGTSLHWFAWAAKNPRLLTEFNHHMTAYHQGRPSWMDPDFFPVEERLVRGLKTPSDGETSVLLVDVAGGKGHDLEEFIRKHPHAPGQLILQELPSVIREIKDLNPIIVPMDYDFFTEQPIKGARGYFLHSILHNWSDENCQKILARVTEAMEPGYSKLLVNEVVIPDTGADWQETALDLMMMNMLSSQERKEAEWNRLFEAAGLKMIQVWRHANGIESLIECELR